jgi:hypothetical protein
MRIIVSLLLLGGAAFGQNYGQAFSVIRLIRQPGATPGTEAIRGHRTARVPVDVIGLRSVTGVAQNWLVEAHGSFASLEATDTALAGAGVASRGSASDSGFATLVGLLRPGLSYRPVEALKAIATARFFQVTFFRTRPGSGMEFAEVMRLRNAAQDQINLDRPEVGYQIISGGESGTYVFLAPLPSLQALDNAIAATWGRSDGLMHAARAAANKISNEADIWREQLLFRVEPGMSFVSEEFGAAAPEFWGGRQ